MNLDEYTNEQLRRMERELGALIHSHEDEVRQWQWERTQIRRERHQRQESEEQKLAEWNQVVGTK